MKLERAARRLQEDINEFTALQRNHYLPRTDIKEDDTSHSYSVTLLSWQLQEQFAPHLNLEKILRYSLIHDFVEIYAGDVNTFAGTEARAAKKIAEQQALELLRKRYYDQPDFLDAIVNYEQMRDDESRFVWSCDKIQALVQGKLDGWRCYYEYGVTNEMFAAKLDEQYEKISLSLRPVFYEFGVACVTSFDNPASRVT